MDQTDRQPHTQADNETAREPDARWMTFRELAEARGISKTSAASLVRRHGWRRQRDNEGHVRALVPLTWASREPGHQSHNEPDNQTAGQADTTPLAATIASLTSAFEAALTVLREQLQGAEQGREAERTQTHELRAQVAALQVQLVEAQAAQDAAEQLRRVDDARRAQGRWARTWAAWRGG
jgi:hypothetical protein